MDDLNSLSCEELIRIILHLREEVERLKRRSGGSAPFSKGAHKPDPKPPGRKPGQGNFRFRQTPPELASAETVQVPIIESCCPNCGGALGEAKCETVTVTDIPVRPEPEVRRYEVEGRICGCCGRSVRGQHPAIAPDQRGATAHRVGPRVKALAHVLHYQHGVPVRKVPAILEELTGVEITQGAITQDAIRRSKGGVGARYEELRASVREREVVHTDDTGWRVGGDPAYLMAFVNSELSVYQIRPRHRNEEVRELIPSGFAGVMVCDRGKSYDAEELQSVAQQKCLSHLIRNAADVAEGKTGRAKSFSLRLKDLLRQALTLGTGRSQLGAGDYQERVRGLDEELTAHLRDRVLRDPDNQRLLDGVGAQHDNGRLLLFLDLDEGMVEPTNNRAERDLRPAVIARKVSHCSKNERGAHAFEVFTSVIQTLRKTNPLRIVADLIDLLGPQPKPT